MPGNGRPSTVMEFKDLMYIVIIFSVVSAALKHRAMMWKAVRKARQEQRNLIVDLYKVQEFIERDDEYCADFSLTKKVYITKISNVINQHVQQDCT